MDLRAEKSMDEAMAAFKAWGKRHGGTRLIEQFDVGRATGDVTIWRGTCPGQEEEP